MTLTTNHRSTLWQLRQLMPKRALTQSEAFAIAELQANKLLELSGIDTPGTPSEVVSGLPSILVTLRDDLPVSGLSHWIKPRWLVCLNSLEPNVRQRFSMMHEFKHILDHGTADMTYRSRDDLMDGQLAEQACDYFAACVLMPKRLVKRGFYQGTRDPTDLAAEFVVSPKAMRYRLQQLGLLHSHSRLSSQHGTSDTAAYARRPMAA